MNDLTFEWDSSKAASNVSKHDVTFEEAKTVFYDDHALIIPDPDHSQKEDRFIIMGQSSTLRILIVVHCFRQKGSSIRIISARRAETKEQKMRKEYDFSNAQRNPYIKRLKKAVTIRLEPDVINYFKSISMETGIPYQNLINLYLLDCAKKGRKLALQWKK